MLAAGGCFSPSALLVPTKEHWGRLGSYGVLFSLPNNRDYDATLLGNFPQDEGVLFLSHHQRPLCVINK